MKTYYELLEVAPNASADEIKRSFRREIAKYHPDKVQHLGQEFQEIAAIKAAELTQAYKTLTDETLRAEYDALVESGGTEAPMHHAPPPPPPGAAPARPAEAKRPPQDQPHVPAQEPQGSSGASVFSQERAGASDLVRRASVLRFRHALVGEFGQYDESAVQGFEIGCVPKPSFFKKSPPRVLARFVPQVDAAALTESWGLASKMKKDGQRDTCVFVMGPVVAPAGALAAAIAEQMRKPTPGGKLFMVPVNTNTWSAHVPNDAPPVIKSLLTRLKSSV